MDAYVENGRNTIRPPRLGFRRQRARSRLNIQMMIDQGYDNHSETVIPMDQWSDRQSDRGDEAGPEGLLCDKPHRQTLNPSDDPGDTQETINQPSSPQRRVGTEQTKFARLTPADSIIRYLLWPAVTICLPILLISAALLWVVLFYRIKFIDSIFSAQSSQYAQYDAYILVNFSATKLVFLASFLSTLAPLLAGCIMSLGSVLVYHKLRSTSDIVNFDKLPTAYQLSLLVGILSASYDQLLTSCRYLRHRKRAKAAPVLLYAFWLLVLSIALGLAVTATDAVLHIKTQTIDLTLYANEVERPSSQFGRGLSAYCLQLDRLGLNSGFACSIGATFNTSNEPGYRDAKPEIQRLLRNNSLVSHIRHVRDSDSDKPLAILLPAARSVPFKTNFGANTLGVSTHCRLVPPRACNATMWGISNVSTTFNCSSEFRGVIGTPPIGNLVTDPSGRALDPDLSFLAIKQSSSLIYNYFTNDSWTKVYNPADLNATGVQYANFTPWPESQLGNPVTVLFAIRTPKTSFRGGSMNPVVKSDKVLSLRPSSIDIFLSCDVRTHEVEYTWVNGSTQTVTAKPHNNGSVLHVWTSLAPRVPRLTTMDADLLDYVLQATVDSNSTTEFENKFAVLLSEKALSTIGAYSTSRSSVREQTYVTRLVAKVPKAALASLLACSLLYPIVGLVLLVQAWRTARGDGSITPLFSYWGLTSTAFLDSDELREEDVDDSKMTDSEDARRLFIRRHNSQGNRFGIWRRSMTGQFSELTPARTRGATWI